MIKTPYVYEDLFTGKDVRVMEKGDGFRSPLERFWMKGEYRKSEDQERRCCRCRNHKGQAHCEIVGDDGSSASHVDPDWVCNFFKEIKL